MNSCFHNASYFSRSLLSFPRGEFPIVWGVHDVRTEVGDTNVIVPDFSQRRIHSPLFLAQIPQTSLPTGKRIGILFGVHINSTSLQLYFEMLLFTVAVYYWEIDRAG
jgi:hypothetical protein